jgi:hypothetical protein
MVMMPTSNNNNNDGDRKKRRKHGILVICCQAILAVLMVVGDSKNVKLVKNQSNVNNNILPATATTRDEREKCQWTVLIGDSNVRELFYAWQRKEIYLSERISEREYVARKRIGKLPKHAPPIGDWTWDNEECYLIGTQEGKTLEDWYMHHEIIIFPHGPNVTDTNTTTSPNSSSTRRHEKCHIISQYFVFNQHGAQRSQRRGWGDFSFCGTRYQTLSKALPPAFKRPPRPDFVWFSHGLWHLPNEGGTNTLNLNCTQRFEETVPALKEWQKLGTQLAWQTLFPILRHHSITNEYITWDYQCQLETAKLHGIPVGDMYRHIGPFPKHWLYYMDYHFGDQAKINALVALLTLAFGWETSYFGQVVLNGTDWSKTSSGHWRY